MFSDENKFDKSKFEKELTDLAKQTREEECQDDMAHLRQIVFWTNMFGLIGLATFWHSVSIVPIVYISTYTFAKWVVIGHHTCHGGYDKVGKGTQYNRFIFGLGARRFIDWFDWFLPEAWNVEHNNRHHYHLGEDKDPDLVEDNMVGLRNAKLPLIVKYLITAILMLSWKYTYYASNTYKEFCIHKHEKKTQQDVVKGRSASMIYSSITRSKHWYTFPQFVVNVIGSYFLFRFVLLPLPLYYIEHQYYVNAFTNLILAEMLTNFHAFVMVATNHCGSDVCRFATPCDLSDKGDFYLRQITGSVNYTNGGGNRRFPSQPSLSLAVSEIIDYVHGYLNYQIEHHLFPDMTMRSYRKMAPKVQAICQKYGVNYIKENVFIRLKKTMDVFVGTASMKQGTYGSPATPPLSE
jgi:fatty acid desaturase